MIAAALATLAAAAPVTLNQATREELDALPMLGGQKADLWLEWRATRGPCTSLDELRDLPGFGAATVAALKQVTSCGPVDPPPPAAEEEPSAPILLRPRTIDVNGASVELLRELPGLPPALAEAIVADRERNGPYESCGALVRVSGIGPATVAALSPVCVAL